MSRWLAAIAFVTLLLALSVIISYFWIPLHSGLFATVLLVICVLLATGCGKILIGWMGLNDVSPSESTLISATLGLGCLSLSVFALAVLHLLYPWCASLLLAVLWLAGYTQLQGIIHSLGANRNLLVERPVAVGSIFIALALSCWTAWVPPHQYDALVYHLALPSAYIQGNSLAVAPELLFAHFPQNGEMLFTLALLLQSDLLAQLFMWLAMALSVWWVFEIGKREAPLPAILLACFLLATHTAVMLLSATTYVEPLVMLWLTAGILSFYRWRQMSSGGPGQRSWLALSAIFIGLALGTKYYAGIAALVLSGVLVWRLMSALPRERRARGADLLIFIALVSVVFSPWLIKNVMLTGNPVFPFMYRFFPMTGTGWRAETAQAYFETLTEYGHKHRLWKDFLSLPTLLWRNNLRFGGGMDVLGDLGWDLVLWCLPLSVWVCRGNRFFRGLLGFCLLYGGIWFATGVVLRFLTALAPILCLLGGGALYRLWAATGPRVRAILATAVVVATVSHLLLFMYVHAVFGSGSVLIGLEDRETFLSRRLDYYPCARFAGEYLGKNDKILLVGEQRGYYIKPNHVVTSIHSPNNYLKWAEQARSRAEFAGKLRTEGFTHILIVPREAARLGVDTLSPIGYSNWAGLEPDFAEAVFRAPACSVSVLRHGGA